MAYPSPYSKQTREVFPPPVPRRSGAAPPELVRVEGTPVWNLRAADGSPLNCAVVEGPDGLVLLGTGASARQGQDIVRLLDARFGRPVSAVVLGEPTRSHCGGLTAVLDAQRGHETPVIAHESWGRHPEAPLREVIYLKVTLAALQHGPELWETDDPARLLSRSLAENLPPSPYPVPSTRVRDGDELDLAGLRVGFLGTDLPLDVSLGVHLPRHRTVLVPTSLHATPGNLMALEGAPPEYSAVWHSLLTRMSALDVDHLAGTRMEPLHGKRRIRTLLSTYEDFIVYLHDQTIRHLLTGRPREDLLHRLLLPEELAEGPFSQPFHGNFAGTALMYHTRYTGWFSGNAVDLAPTPRVERARRSVALMGGAERVLETAAQALDDDPQWAAELARTVVEALPDSESGRAVLARALRALGDRDPNPLRRNWYRCAALDVSGQLRLSDVRDTVQRMFPLPARVLLESLRFRVEPEKAGDRTVSIGVEMSDTGEHFGLLLRNSVLRVHDGVPAEWIAGMRLSTEALTRLVFGEVSLEELTARNEVELQGVSDSVEELWSVIGPRPDLSFHRE